MRRSIAQLGHRHAPAAHPRAAVFAALGAAAGIALLGWLGALSTLKLLLAPMGASCVLLFSVPGSPLSQPANVIGGHILAAVLGLGVGLLLPGGVAGPAAAVGISIAAMMLVRITHPPAGAMALVAAAVTAGKGAFLLSVVSSSVVLVVCALVWHRFTGISYPLKPVNA